MFEDQYHKDQPAVKAMAQRIAANAPQVFKTIDNFVATYGKKAADMISECGLLAALRNIGIDATPASFEGEARDQPKGLSIKRVEAVT